MRAATWSGSAIFRANGQCTRKTGLKETIERAAPRLGVIQVSDYALSDRALPARAVPGDGVIPLQRILGWAPVAG